MKKLIILLIIISTFLFFKCAYSQEWKTLNSGTFAPLLSIFCTDSNTCYAVGRGAVILETSDGGISWFEQDSSVVGILKSVYFINKDTGYAAGFDEIQGGIILKTLDGGKKWTKSDSITSETFNSVIFVNKKIGYAVGNNGIIINTTNGGTNWVLQSYELDTLEFLSSVYFINKDTGFAVGMDNWDYGVIVSTKDGGNHWKIQDSVNPGGFDDIFFPISKIGYILGGTYGEAFIKSTDSGNSWDIQSSYFGYGLSMYFTSVNTGYMAGWNGYLSSSTDDGIIWLQQPSITSNNLYSIYFPNKNTGYAVGDNGTILKYTNPTDITEQLKIDKGQLTIFPNPVTTILNIETKTTIRQYNKPSELKIINIQGQIVYYKQIIQNKLQIDVSGLPQGVYFVRIQKETELSISKIIKL